MARRSIPTNAGWLLTGRVATAAAAVTAAVVAARHLGQDQFGSYVAILAAGLFANTLITFGTDTLIVRSVATEGDAVTVRASLGLQLGLALPLATAGIGLAFVVEEQAAIIAQALGLLPGVWGTTATSVLRGRHRMDQVAASMLAGAAVLVGGALLVRAGSPRLWAYVVVAVVAQVTTSVVAVRLARVPIRPSYRSKLWRAAAPFALMVVSSAAVAACGVVALRVLRGDADAGAFGAANRVVEALRFIPAAAFGAAFPAMSTGLHRTARYRRGVGWLLLAGVVVSIGVAAFADAIIEAVFGEFDDAADVLAVLAFGVVPLILRLRWSFELLAAGRERQVAKISLGSALLTVAAVVLAAARSHAVAVAVVIVVGVVVHAAVLGLVARSAPGRAG